MNTLNLLFEMIETEIELTAINFLRWTNREGWSEYGGDGEYINQDTKRVVDVYALYELYKNKNKQNEKMD